VHVGMMLSAMHTIEFAAYNMPYKQSCSQDAMHAALVQLVRCAEVCCQSKLPLLITHSFTALHHRCYWTLAQTLQQWTLWGAPLCTLQQQQATSVHAWHYCSTVLQALTALRTCLRLTAAALQHCTWLPAQAALTAVKLWPAQEKQPCAL
jgi:hypothetical protein